MAGDGLERAEGVAGAALADAAALAGLTESGALRAGSGVDARAEAETGAVAEGSEDDEEPAAGVTEEVDAEGICENTMPAPTSAAATMASPVKTPRRSELCTGAATICLGSLGRLNPGLVTACTRVSIEGGCDGANDERLARSAARS